MQRVSREWERGWEREWRWEREWEREWEWGRWEWEREWEWEEWERCLKPEARSALIDSVRSPIDLRLYSV
jgi:hypothetical protein